MKQNDDLQKLIALRIPYAKVYNPSYVLKENKSMELFSAAWWAALGTIIVMDLILAGDNALLIGLNAAKVPKPMRSRVVLWGGLGAIAIRFATASVAVFLLKIPGAMIIAGAVLIYLAYGLWKDTGTHSIKTSAVASGLAVGAAIRLIIIGDASMGIENSVAIAGVSHGSWDLIIIGLLLTVPVIFMGANLVIKLVDKYKWLVKVGALLLAGIGIKMAYTDMVWSHLFQWFSAL
jgi:YjbE family integral membrane protein